jgi:predicted ATPase
MEDINKYTQHLEKLRQSGNWEKIIEYTNKFQNEITDKEKLYWNRIISYQLLKKYDLALNEFKNIEKIKPLSDAELLTLAEIYSAKNEFDKSYSIIEKINFELKNADSFTYYNILINELRYIINSSKNKIKDLITTFEKYYQNYFILKEIVILFLKKKDKENSVKYLNLFSTTKFKFSYPKFIIQEITQHKNFEFYIDKLSVKNYFSIEDITIDDLSSKKEIYFLGENGDGKTILLQTFVIATLLDKNSDYHINEALKINEIFNKDNNRQKFDIELLYENNLAIPEIMPLFAYGVNRIHNKSEYPLKSYTTLFTNQATLIDPVEKLKYFYAKELENKSNKKEINISLEKIVNLIGGLLDKIEDFDIKISIDNVIFIEKGTQLEFFQLSDGNKILTNVLVDILFRLIENQPHITEIKDFRGSILIDEIDLFLHPKRQYSLVKKLREKFPKIQWFFTTHSPSLLLGASKDAEFYKVFKKDGKTELEKIDIDIQNINPSILISSPLFETPSIPISNTDFSKYKTNQSYFDLQKEIENNDYLDEKNDFIKKLNKDLFNDKG